MPDILIRGLEMPREDDLLCLNIHPNGDVTINLDLKCIPIARAVELPQHGDLIDRDAFKKENAYFWHRDFINPKYPDTLEDLMLAAPVVVPAERREGDA